MLSPQHWAEATNDLRETLCITYGDCFLLKWDKQKYQKTIPISPNRTKNVGIMTSAPGNNNHLNLCATFNDKIPTIAFQSTMDIDTIAATISEQNSLNDDHSPHNTMSPKTHPLLVQFCDQPNQTLSHPVFDDHVEEYLHWYYHLNHVSLPVMYSMSKFNLLPQES